MKTVGLIGGTSWYSTIDFYKNINTYVEETLGGHNSAKMVIVNVNMEEIVGKPGEQQVEVLKQAASQLQAGGAECFSLCSNGLHEHVDDVAAAVHIPFIHIADSVADAILAEGYKKALLLGARYTMEAGFYREKLEKRGLEIMIPDRDDRVFINNVIYNEATVGVIKPESSARFYEIAGKYVDQGAECVILGCTEIGLLMQQQYTDIPLFDSTSIQSRAIARLVIG